MLTKALDGSLPGDEILLQLVNVVFKTYLQKHEVVFDDPIPGIGNGDTTTYIRPRNWGYVGQQVFNYDRIGLDTFFRDIVFIIAGSLNTIGSTFDLIPLINSKYKTQLQERDIVLRGVTSNQIILEAAPTSYIWKGSVELIIVVDENELENVLFRRNLNGLTMPPSN